MTAPRVLRWYWMTATTAIAFREEGTFYRTRPRLARAFLLGYTSAAYARSGRSHWRPAANHYISKGLRDAWENGAALARQAVPEAAPAHTKLHSYEKHGSRIVWGTTHAAPALELEADR